MRAPIAIVGLIARMKKALKGRNVKAKGETL